MGDRTKIYVLCIAWEGGQCAFATLEEAVAAAEGSDMISHIEEWELGDFVWWWPRPVVWERPRIKEVYE